MRPSLSNEAPHLYKKSLKMKSKRHQLAPQSNRVASQMELLGRSHSNTEAQLDLKVADVRTGSFKRVGSKKVRDPRKHMSYQGAGPLVPKKPPPRRGGSFNTRSLPQQESPTDKSRSETQVPDLQQQQEGDSMSSSSNAISPNNYSQQQLRQQWLPVVKEDERSSTTSTPIGKRPSQKFCSAEHRPIMRRNTFTSPKVSFSGTEELSGEQQATDSPEEEARKVHARARRQSLVRRCMSDVDSRHASAVNKSFSEATARGATYRIMQSRQAAAETLATHLSRASSGLSFSSPQLGEAEKAKLMLKRTASVGNMLNSPHSSKNNSLSRSSTFCKAQFLAGGEQSKDRSGSFSKRHNSSSPQFDSAQLLQPTTSLQPKPSGEAVTRVQNVTCQCRFEWYTVCCNAGTPTTARVDLCTISLCVERRSTTVMKRSGVHTHRDNTYKCAPQPTGNSRLLSPAVSAALTVSSSLFGDDREMDEGKEGKQEHQEVELKPVVDPITQR